MPLVYDVYGTLLDVDAATRIAAAEPGMEALAREEGRISALWRQRQLAHSWLISLMQCYQPFWEITCTTLDLTLDEVGITDPKIRARLLDLYLGRAHRHLQHDRARVLALDGRLLGDEGPPNDLGLSHDPST